MTTSSALGLADCCCCEKAIIARAIKTAREEKGRPTPGIIGNSFLWRRTTPESRLCYSFHLHGYTPAEPVARACAGTALLPELRRGSHRSPDLRRLFGGHLSPLRDAAGISR